MPFPAWRLKAFVFPWADGWPANVVAAGQHRPFTGGEEPLFWETVCYVGWLPLVAAAFLAARLLLFRRRPERRWLVVALIGTAALVLALPVAIGSARRAVDDPAQPRTAGVPDLLCRRRSPREWPFTCSWR